MDSRGSKDSNDILFANFGLTDRELWFFKVSVQIWFNFYFENLFDLDEATWRSRTGRYRFVRIGTEAVGLKGDWMGQIW
jgi:hypothetical protein